MTVSARCYINRHKPVWRVAYKAINVIFWFQVDHCKESFDEDIKYAEEVMKYVESNS
jgi:pterin-4a-carbinolamine dehydratase